MSVAFALLILTLSANSLHSRQEEDSTGFQEETETTRHTIRINDEKLRYEATAGTLLLKEEDGTPKASIFYTAYVMDGVEDQSQRPITFCFNGGPGSSSVWLHLGAFGPRIVRMGDAGNLLAPPYQLRNNEFTILDLTDLVFIDPVTTGYSRAVPGEDDKQFHGLQEDVKAVAEFIRLYVSREERWDSPKFLSGESYGTTRASRLVDYLQDRHGIYFNGLVLVSAILNFQTARFDRGNDLPYLLFLPTYTATAWYHSRLEKELQDLKLPDLLEMAREFALNEYATALLKGSALPADERMNIVRQLARFTGLTPEYVESTNMRIHIRRFVKELRRNERRTVGRLDSRFVGIDYDSAGDGYEYDPSYAAIQGPFTAAFNQYVREELEFESDLPYEILTGRVHPWSYAEAENKYVNVAENLRQAMTKNPDLRVFVANGYYDLATPFFATEHTFHHLGLDPTLQRHFSMGFYESGHMMYIHPPSHKKLKEDLQKFFEVATRK